MWQEKRLVVYLGSNRRTHNELVNTSSSGLSLPLGSSSHWFIRSIAIGSNISFQPTAFSGV